MPCPLRKNSRFSGKKRLKRVRLTCCSLEQEVAAVDTELRNLAETAAKGGAVPIVLEALARREADRRRLRAELDACDPPARLKPTGVLRAQLRRSLDDWQGLLSRNVAEARPLLDLVLADRIRFAPIADRYYHLTVRSRSIG